MEVPDLYENWQRLVRKHAELVRNARMSHVGREELEVIEGEYIRRIDAAYFELKKREGAIHPVSASQAAGACASPQEQLRQLSRAMATL